MKKIHISVHAIHTVKLDTNNKLTGEETIGEANVEVHMESCSV